QLGQSGTGELVEIRLDEHTGQFAGAVGAEVHEDHRVAVLDLDRFADAGGFDEFIALVAGIGRFQTGHRRVGAVFGNTVDDQVVGGGYAVPAVVAVHGEVAADDAGNAALAKALEGGVEQFQRGL